jgi:hypothetical protein
MEMNSQCEGREFDPHPLHQFHHPASPSSPHAVSAGLVIPLLAIQDVAALPGFH